MNFLTETQQAIKESGHIPPDICFIGSEKSGHSCTWELFCTLANIEYDNGFGAQHIAEDLIIVFHDGQRMWRGEYDGSEWWNFSRPFTQPETLLPITSLIVSEDQVGWCTLAEIND